MVYVRRSRVTEASELLDEVILDLQSDQPNLVQCCQQVIRVCHLLVMDEDACDFERELKGYPSPQDVPDYRSIAAAVLWVIDGVTDPALRQLVIASNPALEDTAQGFGLTVTLAELVRMRSVGYFFHTGRRSAAFYAASTMTARQYTQISPADIERVLDNVTTHLFSWASRTKVDVEHERSVNSLFEGCAAAVEESLALVGLDGWLQQIREGLRAETPEGNASAVLACRNLITELSDHLLQVDTKQHPLLKDKVGKAAMSLTRDKVKNRYRAYLHEMGVRSQVDHLQKSLERLVDFAVELYDRASSGKRAIGDDEMQACVMQTYMFIGELDRLTSLEPVYEFAVSYPAVHS